MHTLKLTFFFAVGMLTGIGCMYVAAADVEPIFFQAECAPSI